MSRRLRVLTTPSCFGCQSRHRNEWASLQGDDPAISVTGVNVVSKRLCEIFARDAKLAIGVAFHRCSALTNMTLLSGVTVIGYSAFESCASLTSITIPNSVTTIGDSAFAGCTSLTNVVIGNSVTSIEGFAFYGCFSLKGAYFQGNAPSVGSEPFYGATNVTVYYLPGTAGWGSNYGNRPTAPWVLPYPVILTTPPNFGLQTNGFGFRISWATNVPVVVEASATLANPSWTPVLGSIMLIVVEFLLVDVRLLAWNNRGFELLANGVELNLLVFRRVANCRIQKENFGHSNVLQTSS